MSMKFRSQKYKVEWKDKTTRSKWVNQVDVGDTIQFQVYSEGRGGSGTTYHLIKNGDVVYPNGEEGEHLFEEKNAFGTNIITAFWNNLELKDIGY